MMRMTIPGITNDAKPCSVSPRKLLWLAIGMPDEPPASDLRPVASMRSPVIELVSSSCRSVRAAIKVR